MKDIDVNFDQVDAPIDSNVASVRTTAPQVGKTSVLQQSVKSCNEPAAVSPQRLATGIQQYNAAESVVKSGQSGDGSGDDLSIP